MESDPRHTCFSFILQKITNRLACLTLTLTRPLSCNRLSCHNLLVLLKHLWPGSWKHLLKHINHSVIKYNNNK